MRPAATPTRRHTVNPRRSVLRDTVIDTGVLLKISPSRVEPLRPQMRVLVALPGLVTPEIPCAFCLIDLMNLPRWELWGWSLVALDPADEVEYLAWRRTHPEAV